MSFLLVLARLDGLGLSPSLGVYLVLFCALSATLVAAAWAAWSPLRWLLACIFSAGTLFAASFASAMGQELTYDAFTNLWDARGFVGDAAGQFTGDLLWGALQAGLLFFGIGLDPKDKGRHGHVLAGLVPLGALVAVSVMFYVRGGDGGRGLPGAFVAPAYAMVLAFDTIRNDPGARQPVRLRHIRPRTDDVVLIVDESIAGQYLDINNKAGVYTGLASKRPSFAIHNFGIASSITHCSTGSNLTLRYGGTRQNYRRINATGPSLWSYAKAAGLSTVYIDAQRTGGAYQNGMDDAERVAIDRWIQFDDIPVMNRDMAVADRLAQLLNDGKPQFILVNKMGAHFPVQAKYPEGQTRFRPVASREEFFGIVEPTVRDTSSVNRDEWRLYRNAYRNVVQWNVGAFFDRLFAAAKASRATLIYTADHGQNLHESGELGNATHCTPEPAIEEGVVPLVVIESSQASDVDWKGAASRNWNGTSHYRIFPTLLGLMGYEPRAVRDAYGKRIDDPSRDKLMFNTNFNARLGRDPVWKEIDTAQIKALRADDYDPLVGMSASRRARAMHLDKRKLTSPKHRPQSYP